jgi:hypothetical protein
MSTDARRLHAVPPAEAFTLPMPAAPPPQIEPGRYVGVVVIERLAVHVKENGRKWFTLHFDVWRDAEAVGRGCDPLARRVPAPFPLDLNGTSRYAGLVALVFPPEVPRPRRALVASDLAGRLWAVEVATVAKGWHGRARAVPYSKIREVLGVAGRV